MGSRNSNSTCREVCPSWSFATKSCLSTKSGLYLPVAQHIEIYCEGGGYPSCPQFIKQAFSSELANGDKANRRHCRRVPGRFFTRLTERTNDALSRVVEDAAVTVDLSAGGIRFELCQSLAEGSEIEFSLDGDFSDTPLHGAGQVKWCRSLESAPLYHAGISFADKAIASAVSDRLGLVVN